MTMAVAVAIGIAVTAIIAARNRVAGKAAGHAADHGAHDAVRGQAADQRAAACAQRRRAVMGMAAARVSGSGDSAGAKHNQASGGDLGYAFHLSSPLPFGIRGDNVKPERMVPVPAHTIQSMAGIRRVPWRESDSPYSPWRRVHRKCWHPPH